MPIIAKVRRKTADGSWFIQFDEKYGGVVNVLGLHDIEYEGVIFKSWRVLARVECELSVDKASEVKKRHVTISLLKRRQI